MLENEKFIVYGAGGYGQKFVKAVYKMGLGNHFLGYAVTHKKEGDASAICEIHQVHRKQLIVIAAHNKNSKQMEQTLNELGFEHYISIYPYLTELFWGQPYEIGVELDVRMLVQKSRDVNYCAALYCAIDYVMGNNTGGKDLYIRTMMLMSDKETAYGRWKHFAERVATYRQSKIPEQYDIKVDPGYCCILDGFHRLMLAYYFDFTTILADLYRIDVQEYEEFYSRSTYKDKEFYSILNKNEKRMIEDFKVKIME